MPDRLQDSDNQPHAGEEQDQGRDKQKRCTFSLFTYKIKNTSKSGKKGKENKWKEFRKLIEFWAIIITAGVTSAYTVLTYNLWNTAKKSNIINERPWVHADISAFGGVSYDVNGLNIGLKFKFHNVGHAPAVFVTTRWIVSVVKLDVDPLILQKEQCNRISGEKRDPREDGITVFPGQEPLTAERTSLPWAEFGTPKPNTLVELYVAGCIDYQYFVFDGHHQTGFIFTVARVKPEQPSARYAFDVADGAVAESSVALDDWIDGGGFYAD